VYAINTGTGQATRLFSDEFLASINFLAYDPYSQVVYYTNWGGATTNKPIFKYEVKTCIRTTFIADVTASPFNASGLPLPLWPTMPLPPPKTSGPWPQPTMGRWKTNPVTDKLYITAPPAPY
jgi:hypothetical protein